MPRPYYKIKSYQSRRSVGYLLRRAGKLMTARIEALFEDEEDITFTQWVLLMNLRDKLHVTAAELSQQLCHDSGALTRVIDNLEKRALLVRHRSKTDRRVVELELTKEGRKVTEAYLPPVIAMYNEIFSDFSREEADYAVDLLIRLVTKLDTMAPRS